MALYIPHSIFHLARLLYVRPETFGPYYVYTRTYIRRRVRTYIHTNTATISSVRRANQVHTAVIFVLTRCSTLVDGH